MSERCSLEDSEFGRLVNEVDALRISIQSFQSKSNSIARYYIVIQILDFVRRLIFFIMKLHYSSYGRISSYGGGMGNPLLKNYWSIAYF